MTENLTLWQQKKVDYIFIAGNNVNAYNQKKDFLNSISNNKAEIIIAKDGFGNINTEKPPLYVQDFIDKDDNVNIYDIGLKGLNQLYHCVNSSDLIFWNGTLGIVENMHYNSGSICLLNMLNQSNAKVIIGGGDTASFVNKYENKFYHISTGGGASIDYLGNETLPGIF